MPRGTQPDPEEVRRYMREAVESGTNEDDTPKLRLAKKVVPHRHRDRLRAAATTALQPYARRKLAELSRSGPLRLNLGSGYRPVDGMINIDRAGAPVDLAWNLSQGIPFNDGSVQWTYSAHVLEHLTLPNAWGLFEECWRVLGPGGLIRVVVPDAGLLLGSYSGTNQATWAREFPAPMLAVNALFYKHGHRTMWDAQLLIAALAAAGFADVRERRYLDSDMDPCPDHGSRESGSLFVEGRKHQGLGPEVTGFRLA